MEGCASCSASLLPGSNFCPACGARVSIDSDSAREVRKTVTVLFSDLVGSTTLGEQLDPEQLRTLMGRYFGAMSAVIRRHGGTVEKFIGDAIMAVFGIPVVHEDDALRAVRAAVEMRHELGRLNDELRPRGLEIRSRTGVNTGEVVTGDPTTGRTLVTGDAVNTAARFEQAAEPGEILLGDATRRLVRDAVRTEAMPPLTLKGKAHPTTAYRLIEVSTGATTGLSRRSGAPLVGRGRELEHLRQTWERVVADRSPQLVTVLGGAGVGKSRLSTEFLAGIDDAAVLHGRCLPYGEGITYWPLAEALRSAAGIDEGDPAHVARGKLDDLVRDAPGGDRIGPLLHEAVGLANEGTTQDELFWAVRRTLEHLARTRPLVVVWDDLHWAQPTFLDLLELLSEWCRDVHLLFLGMARPELLDVRPGWGGGNVNSSTIVLEPLDAAAVAELLLQLPGGGAVPDDLRRRIADKAEGNPLFVEEILRMLIDDGRLEQTEDGWKVDAQIAAVPVPGSITALLTARLDLLGIGERQVAERASVIGRVFDRGAIVELSPPGERPEVMGRLLSLVRKELVRPEAEPGMAGDDAYRFRHLLIRDVAYEALPKADRASLHVAFANWLEGAAGDRFGEYAEVVAHHLERAFHYRAELGETGLEKLGSRAASALASAARRAQMRGDLSAAMSLRHQALQLPMASADRVDLLVQQARGELDNGEPITASSLLDEADDLAAELDDEALRMRIRVGRGFVVVNQAAQAELRRVAADARHAAGVLEAAGDLVGVARALDLLATSSFFGRDSTEARAAWRSAADWAVRSGDRGEAARILPALPATATYGWATSAEAIEYCRGLAREYPDPPMLHARILATTAGLHAWRGEVDQALRLREESRAVLDDVGLPWLTGEIHLDYADVDLGRGAYAEAEREALLAYQLTTRARWPNAWITILSLLEALHHQGRHAEARAWVERIPEVAGVDDLEVRAYIDAWHAVLDALEGKAEAARERLGRSELPGTDPADDAAILDLRGEAHALIGDRDAALEEFRTAAATYERKEYFALRDKVRAQIERLETPPP